MATPLHFAVVAVDIALLSVRDEGLCVLLGGVDNPSYKGKKALIGGIVTPKETTEEALIRLLREKAAVAPPYFEQVHTFSALDRDVRGRVVAVGYLGLLPASGAAVSSSAVWVPVAAARGLAYDHDAMLAAIVERLRLRTRSSNIARHLLPDRYTFSELQQCYEAIFGHALDKRNLKRKLVGSGVIVGTTEFTKRGSKRPAQLFRFASKKDETYSVFA